ncbi:hypothetical protein FISHEDRAFT_63335 [Fistulina hepatica ATCC 64428]|uniref:Glutamate--tRNA ligase, mitochondrial n=1 Tax=Fistulina hepatica ATCC 64428 TaxID=1128425 RepID=A0A0D7ARQ7_9AGAR|nr:hypothetical protein FISHEDRAFT_63335 [Fistulina hepatica ATCC 64428]
MTLLRFAPSPTGRLHLGGLRMALLNHLHARKTGGKWILRIEDTDNTRFIPEAVEDIRGALEWAGLDYDYGPGKSGPHEPYFQSQRLDLYHHYAKKLLDSGHAYRCFCSPDQLTEIREKLARQGSNATYDKRCLYLTDEEVARRVRAGNTGVIRLNDSNLPSRPATTDIVFGPLRDAHRSLATDPVLLKTDHFPTYHLASVVDDHEMGITHVLRGEEWITSLPLHLDLYACLGIEPPQFAHVPILINPDGSKMSKRNNDVQVTDYIQKGWEPQAVLNWLSLAGWGVHHDVDEPAFDAPDSTTLMTMNEMIQQFDLTRITHHRQSLDSAKLEFLNKRHLIGVWSSPEGRQSLAVRLQPTIVKGFPTSECTTIPYIQQVIQAMNGRLTNILDVPRHGPFFFVDPDLTSDEAQRMSGPPIADVMNVLGLLRTLQRLKIAIALEKM